MKITIIGGAGVRVPLLVNGLVKSDLPITDIVLFDVDVERQRIIGDLAARFAGAARVSSSAVLADALGGADFVFMSIRIGGAQSRARDEAITIEHGLIAQETIGPCGFAMAMRTIPAAVAYAREIVHHAPGAWVINFTNPVGIITQAVRETTGARIIGICDTPTELFEEVAHALEVPSAECYFDYVGLNHLGWVREVYHRGVPQLTRLWDQPEVLKKVYRAPLFENERLRVLRLLPTEYVYYYYCADHAFRNIARAGVTRGEVIERLNTQLFRDLQDTGRDAIATYEQYLATRNAGYMQIESGASAPLARSPWAELTGYDKIALQTVQSIHFNLGTIVPLNVVNHGNLPELESSDVIEAPCVVNANGALALHVGSAPEAIRDLLVHVKDYERRTVKAGLTQDRAAAVDALARNPLIASPAQAEALVAALTPE